MAKYIVKVIDTLARVIKVEAESHAAAKEIAEDMWFNGELNLSALDNLEDHEVYVIERED